MKAPRMLITAVVVIALVLVVVLVWQTNPVSATRVEPSAPASPSAVASSGGGAAEAASEQLLAAAGLAAPEPDGAVRVDAAAVRRALADVPDGGEAAGYDRAAFGPAWADVDHNGCDTRNDVLRRDLDQIALKPGTHDCVVLSGTLHDPYTGTTIAFTRGQGTSEAVQIDHMVPLALAWRHGAAGWTATQREAFANDPVELLAVQGSANTSKSDSGPSGWLPVAADRCVYAARFVLVERTYALTIAPADRAALQDVLADC